MSEIKFCPKCGSSIENDERFCGHCGFDTESLEHREAADQKMKDALVQKDDLDSESLETLKNNTPLPTNTPPKKDTSKKVLIIIVAVLGVLLFIGAILFWWYSYGYQILDNGNNNAIEEILDQPSYSLNEGSYTGEQTVSINKPNGEGIQVFYTIDSTEPSQQSILYESPILLKENTILKSIAIDSNGNQSPVKSASYTITIVPPATQPTTPTYSESDERAQFESNISGVWERREGSGFVLYYQFYSPGELVITDGGSDYYAGSYTFSIEPGNNGTIGTVYAGPNTIYIDCNPIGDNAIYIDGYLSPYSP